MAWTAPASWAVSEVVLASKMNTHVRDNLAYLKGQAGTVAIESGMTVAGSVVATVAGNNQGILSALSGNSGVLAGIGVGRTANEVQMAIVASAAQFFAGSAAGDMVLRDLDGAKKTMIGSGTTAIATLAPGPLVGIGTASPAGALHVAGSTGGGMMFLSATAVTSLQTLAPNGTVTQSAQFFGYDRNNTGGGLQLISNTPAALGAGPSISNTDTIVITVTAGGAITVQRTSGTNGTHDLQMLVLYK